MGSTERDDRDWTIAVVGGGIGGLCTAIGLLRQGIKVQVYESAPAFAEIGAGVSFGPNAARAMELIDPKIREGFDRCATNNAWADRNNYWFSFRRGQDHSSSTGTLVTNLECKTGQTSVHRARYLDELVRLIPDGVANFGKRLDEVEDKGDHVVLHFHDGSTAEHAAVIGCDGVKSKVRQFLLGKDNPNTNPTFSGKYAYRGLIPMDDAVNLMGDELARNSQLYMGKGGHILTFPIEKGKTMNVVAFNTPKDGKWESEEWVKPMDQEAMFKDFAGWVESTRQILSLMQKPDIWALFDHPHASTYFRNRVAMLGDSAHASTPHQGAGAGMAIEDALIMSRVMAQVQDAKDIPTAFEVYDGVRRPRSQKLVTTSREAGLLYDMEQPGIEDDVEKIKELLHVRMKWIWEIDLQAHIDEAVKMMNGRPLKL